MARRRLGDGDALPQRREQAETGLVFIGLVALVDPLRPQVADAVAQCHEAGIRRRLVMRRVSNGVMFVGLAVGVYVLLPRPGGLLRNVAELRHARPALCDGGSGARVLCPALPAGAGVVWGAAGFCLAARITLASFLVSHVTPFGSVAGRVLNVSTLENEGVAASMTTEAIGLTSPVSTVALIVLFGAGLVATVGRLVSRHTW